MSRFITQRLSTASTGAIYAIMLPSGEICGPILSGFPNRICLGISLSELSELTCSGSTNDSALLSATGATPSPHPRSSTTGKNNRNLFISSPC
jgi:hypothetical protein